MLSNRLTQRLSIQFPIIQAPMAGGITTSELVSESSNAGALGMIGAGYLTPMQLKKQIRSIKKLTTSPFGVNLFVPEEVVVSKTLIEESNSVLSLIRKELKIFPIDLFHFPTKESLDTIFMDNIKVIIEEKVPVCSFTFGIPSEDVIKKLKMNDVFLIGTATTVEEAIANESAGMDAIVAQGSEAGGHRGSFLYPEKENAVGLMSLIPQIVDHVAIPVIAAGGIMDGRGLVATHFLGAEGCQMGTAFLTCDESGAPAEHKDAILETREDQIIMTRAMTGKWAKGIENRFMSNFNIKSLQYSCFAVHSTLTQDIRKYAKENCQPDFMSLWSGQSPRLAKTQKVSMLVSSLVQEVKNILPDA